MSDIYTLDDAFSMMKNLGKMLGLREKSEMIIEACQGATNKVKKSRNGRVIYLIWKNPWMAVGSDTYIDYLLHFLGYENLIMHDRYPEISIEEIKELKPDKILLSSEPFPFKEQDLNELKDLIPKIELELVDGEMFSWYGSRLQYWK